MEDSVAPKTDREFETCPFSLTQFCSTSKLKLLEALFFEVFKFFNWSFSVDIFKDESFAEHEMLTCKISKPLQSSGLIKANF